MTGPQTPAIAPPPSPPRAATHGALSNWWLRTLFSIAGNHEHVVRFVRPIAVWFVVAASPHVRRATAANAKRLISPDLTPGQCRSFARRVVSRFIDFITDTAQGQAHTPEQLRARIDKIEGHDRFIAARAQHRGAIVVTAHMGSFELGMASLTAIEPNVHVVFKRDVMDGFEKLRRDMHRTLGVREAAIDDGWATWMQLRDALRQDHVVVLQGDRTMPGQKNQRVPMAGGHIALPLGPWVLAAASGSPIVPIFTVATTPGRCRLCVEEPIEVDANAPCVDGVHPAMQQLAAAIEKYVTAYPDQWLLLSPAFIEDAHVCANTAETSAAIKTVTDVPRVSAGVSTAPFDRPPVGANPAGGRT